MARKRMTRKKRGGELELDTSVARANLLPEKVKEWVATGSTSSADYDFYVLSRHLTQFFEKKDGEWKLVPGTTEESFNTAMTLGGRRRSRTRKH